MADVWGGSWAASWALTWTPEEVTPPTADTPRDGGKFSIKDPRHPYWRNRIEEEEPDLSDAAQARAAPSPADNSVVEQRPGGHDAAAPSPVADIVGTLLDVTSDPVAESFIDQMRALAATPQPQPVDDDDDEVMLLLLLD